MVWRITKMSVTIVHLRNKPLMRSLFPLAWVSFEEISRESIDEVPVLKVNTPIKKKKLPSRLLLSNGRFIYLDLAGCGVPLILTKINTTAASPWDDSGRWLMIIVVAQRTEVSVRPFLREHHPELSGSQPEGIQFRVNCSSLPHPP